MKKIIVYCEKNPNEDCLSETSYELISKAKEIAIEAKLLKNDEDFIVEAVLLDYEIDSSYTRKAYKAGANRFVLIKHDCLKTFFSTVYSSCFVEYFNQNPADVIIFPASPRGRMTAPRITSLLDTGLVADCTGLEFILRENKLRLAPTRPTFGSELMATILSKKNPQCATIRPKTFKPVFAYDECGQYEEFSPDAFEESRCKIVRTVIDREYDENDFSRAKIVFALGFGLADGKNRKYFEKVEKLAKIFDAKIASTRKLVDFNLMSPDTQIGQTGSTVCADLYIAFGISGAIQHIQGMKNCKNIIAINTDSNADIFKYSDYKIVADAKKIIDELYEHYV